MIFESLSSVGGGRIHYINEALNTIDYYKNEDYQMYVRFLRDLLDSVKHLDDDIGLANQKRITDRIELVEFIIKQKEKRKK